MIDEFDAILADDHGGLFRLEPDEIERQEESKRAQAVARRRRRIETRRAKSEAALAEALPAAPEPGVSYHVISHGDVDSLSYLAWLVRVCAPLDYAMLSTWCMAMPDVEQLAAWLDAGAIRWLDVYVGEIFLSQYPQEYARVADMLRAAGRGRMCVCRNHAKIMLAAAGERRFTIESSANVNTNPRIEQTAVHDAPELFAHYKEFYDSLKSFDRAFDDRRPWMEWRKTAEG